MRRKHRGQWPRILSAVPEPELFLDFGPGKENSEAWEVQEVWPNCNIVGIEACVKRYTKLKKSYPGTLLHFAVDEYEGQARGYVGGRYGMFKFWLEKEDKVNNHKETIVPATTVDCIYEKFGGETVFIWADIEGAELRMLRGAVSLLSSDKVLGLNLELFPQNAQLIWPVYTGNRCTADQVIDFLSQHSIECRGSIKHPNLSYGDFESKNWFDDFLFVRKGMSLEDLTD